MEPPLWKEAPVAYAAPAQLAGDALGYPVPTSGLIVPKSMQPSQTLVAMIALQLRLQSVTSPWPPPTPPEVLVNWTMMNWFNATFTGVARFIVVKVNVDMPVRLSTSWTVNVWPTFTATQVWPGKLHGGPMFVVVGVLPAGNVAISSWLGATFPTKSETLTTEPVRGDFIALPVPHFDPS